MSLNSLQSQPTETFKSITKNKTKLNLQPLYKNNVMAFPAIYFDCRQIVKRICPLDDAIVTEKSNGKLCLEPKKLFILL